VPGEVLGRKPRATGEASERPKCERRRETGEVKTGNGRLKIAIEGGSFAHRLDGIAELGIDELQARKGRTEARAGDDVIDAERTTREGKCDAVILDRGRMYLCIEVGGYPPLDFFSHEPAGSRTKMTVDRAYAKF